MAVFVGLDVSLASVSICLVDENGALVREGKTDAEPEAIMDYLRPYCADLVRVGLEAGPMSEWIGGALQKAGLPAVCLKARQVKAALSAMVVKTDRNDARGIAQVTRTGWFKAVHIKSLDSQRSRTLVTARKFVVRAVASSEQAIRGLLRPFGLKVGAVTRRRFAARVHELLDQLPMLRSVIEPLLDAHAALVVQALRLHRQVLQTVRTDPVCRRLMTMPGIGPVTALTFRATVDDAGRFRKSRSIGAYLGLTPRRYQSGEVDRVGRISKGRVMEKRGLPSSRPPTSSSGHPRAGRQ